MIQCLQGSKKMIDSSAVLTTAKKAAAAAAEVHTSYRKEGFTSSSKEEHHNIVTSADVDSEKAIINVIRQSFPDHNIIAEEGLYPETASPWVWYIDPLDGTNNFFKGLPHFAVSIAAACEGELAAGVVRNTAGNDSFYAEKGKGAFYNGKPIRVSAHESLKNAMLFTGFHYDRGEYMRKTLKAIEFFFQNGIIGIRRSGCAALDLCYIAAGWGDGFWEHVLSPWDYSAGRLIINEAGGMLTGFDGKDTALKTSSVVAANPAFHKLLRQAISKLYQNTEL